MLDEDLKQREYQATQSVRIEWEKAKERMNNLPTIESYTSFRPEKPKEPEKPVYQRAGLFNKARIDRENEQSKQNYERQLTEYQTKLQEYDKAIHLFNIETEEKIKAAREEAVKKLDEATVQLEKAGSTSVGNNERKLLAEEIKEANDIIRRLIKGKNSLYSLDIVFGKYRNLVALSSFYEYLLSGRCELLEGPNGAYNIYEAEIRANQIISQLSEVLASLEQIKNNQYTAYSKLQSIQSDLVTLNSLTNQALKSLEKATIDLEAIGTNSEVIAYNTAQTAFYTKKNNELTRALGLMVALK